MTTVHLGNAVKSIREMLKIKQTVLAEALGYSQQNISKLEASPEIDKDTLELIAQAMNVPVEAIENFNPDKAFQIIATTFTNKNEGEGSAFYQHQPSFQIADKAFDLYERMIGELRVEKLKLEVEVERLRNERASKELEIAKLQTELERLKAGK